MATLRTSTNDMNHDIVTNMRLWDKEDDIFFCEVSAQNAGPEVEWSGVSGFLLIELIESGIGPTDRAW